MASIKQNVKNGKVVSYRFRACVGRDAHNKQIFKTTTWSVPNGLTGKRLEREAEKQAQKWETQARADYEKDLANPERVREREISASKVEFTDFVDNVWFPLALNEADPAVISFNASMEDTGLSSSQFSIRYFATNKLLNFCPSVFAIAAASRIFVFSIIPQVRKDRA